MDFNKKMKELVALQAAKIGMEFTIVDFAEEIIKNYKNGFFPQNKAAAILLDLENAYTEFVIDAAENRVSDLFIKHAEEIINQRDEIIEEVEDLGELEEVTDDDDLDYVIKLNLKSNYIKIEETQGFYPDDQVWLYKNFFGLDINNREELEKAERDGIFREGISW